MDLNWSENKSSSQMSIFVWIYCLQVPASKNTVEGILLLYIFIYRWKCWHLKALGIIETCSFILVNLKIRKCLMIEWAVMRSAYKVMTPFLLLHAVIISPPLSSAQLGSDLRFHTCKHDNLTQTSEWPHSTFFRHYLYGLQSAGLSNLLSTGL